MRLIPRQWSASLPDRRALPARLGRVVAACAGLAVGVYLIAEHGFEEILRALHVAGWAGLLSITVYHVLPTVLCASAWRLLLGRRTSERLTLFAWVRWIRDGLDGIVPILPVSGELIGARILALRGVELGGASVVVDLTAELVSGVLFAAIGFILLVVFRPGAPYRFWIGAGVGLMALQSVGFLLAQRKGLFRLIERPFEWLRARGRRAESDAERTLHEGILVLYAHLGTFMGGVLLHLVAWVAGGLEVWIGLWFLGHPLGVGRSLAIEGIVYAARSVFFFVPLAAGVQEGCYVLIGGLFGLTPDLALALSLLKRGRDLIKGVPALLAWQLIEVRQLRRARGGVGP